MYLPRHEALAGASELVLEVDRQAAAYRTPSGASHDAAYVAKKAPTGMLFVPSRDGLSHAPEEWSSVEDIARGAEVMAEALLTLDDQ